MFHPYRFFYLKYIEILLVFVLNFSWSGHYQVFEKSQDILSHGAESAGYILASMMLYSDEV